MLPARAQIPMFVNKIWSAKTQLPFNYYSLPFCKPEKIETERENLGQILVGDRIQNSDYTVGWCARACGVRGGGEARVRLCVRRGGGPKRVAAARRENERAPWTACACPERKLSRAPQW